MGVNLAPIIVKHTVQLEALAGKRLAIDANNVLYQFLALIRSRTGSPLTSPDGLVTSHLTGLLYRTTRLISEYHIEPIFIFDGKPPEYKKKEIKKRREIREKAAREWRQALKAHDYAKAFSKAATASQLTQSMVQDAKKLLGLLGVPYLQAPSEAEAQAAYMATTGDVWACSSRDYDSLLFGAPRLVRYLTISGKEFLPSKGTARPLKPEIIILSEFLLRIGLTNEELIDAAILMGTDFNDGIKGIGPKRALNLIKKHGSIETLPEETRNRVPHHYEVVRGLFLNPNVTPEYTIRFAPPIEDELYAFLCDQKGFSRVRVKKAVQRISSLSKHTKQLDLETWFGSTN